MSDFQGNRSAKGEEMINRTLKTGRALVSLALVIAASVAIIPSSSSAGLPSVRAISPDFDIKNDTFASDELGKYYAAGGHSFYKYVGAGSTITITYLVTSDGTTPATGKDIDFMVNAPYSGSTAKWEVNGTAVGISQNSGTGYGLLVAGKTDASGKVSFTIKNTDDSSVAEEIPTSENMKRPATRLYGNIKAVIRGVTDMEQAIDLLTFDITKSPASVLPAAATPAPSATATPTPSATATPSATPSATATPSVTAVAPAAQTVTAVATSLKVGKSLTLPAKSTAGIAIKWVSTTKTVCTVSGSKVTAKKAGSCSVTGTNAGDAKNKALSVTKKITVK